MSISGEAKIRFAEAGSGFEPKPIPVAQNTSIGQCDDLVEYHCLGGAITGLRKLDRKFCVELSKRLSWPPSSPLRRNISDDSQTLVATK
jgi:hypothetical protein